MDYEKKYKEALEKARQLCAYPTTKSFISDLQDLFLELKESQDEKVRKELIKHLKEGAEGYEPSGGSSDYQRWLAWVEKQGEKKPEENKGNLGGISPNWKGEDKQHIRTIIHAIHGAGNITPIDGELAEDWLKSLRPQNTYNPYKAVVESIAEMCKHYDKASHSGLRDFYDNVKVKCKDAQEYDKMFPQAHWKPTDEQMGCLSDAIEHYNSLGYPAPKLKELYEQLKKLKEV